MGQVQETTQKELTLDEWVSRLPDGHRAKDEYRKLLAARDTLKTVMEAVQKVK